MCCKDCKERYLGCHGHCPKYLAEKEKNDKIRAQIRLEHSTTLHNSDFLDGSGVSNRRPWHHKG